VTTTINASTSSGLVNTADTSGILALQTANTTALTIDASQNTGFGTTSPSYKVDVVSTGNSLNSNLASRNTTSGTAAGAQILVGNDSTNDLLVLRALSSTYTSSGVNTANGALVRGGGAGGMTLAATDASGIINFATGGTTERMRIDSSGNVGVGTASPWSQISSYGASGATTQYIGFKNADGGDIRFGKASGVDNNAIIGTWGGNPLLFYTNSSERMRIDSSGNLLVGTTSQLSGSTSKLVVDYATGDFVAGFRNSNASPLGLYVFQSTDVNGGGNPFIYCVGGLNVRFSFKSNGGINNFSANDSNLSDRREKINFAPAKSYLNTICSIPVQTFNYIDQSEDDPGLTLGVVAQDVQAVAPEMVTESNWGTEEAPKMRLSIYQTDLQYALMKSIQELKAINDTQAETINALTARIVALEK
jgi:hypothetical protein